MEIIGLNVLETRRVRQYEKKTGTTTRIVNVVDLVVEGATYANIEIQSGVEIPEGWSGRASCYGVNQQLTVNYKNGPAIIARLNPVLCVGFVPISQVRKDVDFSAFFSKSPNPVK